MSWRTNGPAMLEKNWLIFLAAQEAGVALGYHQIPQQSASISKWVIENLRTTTFSYYFLLDSMYYLALQINLIQ